jgi:hypothetical protein
MEITTITADPWVFITAIGSSFGAGAFVVQTYWCPKEITKMEYPCEILVNHLRTFNPPDGFVVKKIEVESVNGKRKHAACMKILGSQCTITKEKCYLLRD